jgi:transposase
MTLGLCAHTVGTYIRKYKEGGLQSLVPAPKPCAPRMLTKEQEQQLVEVIPTKTPDEVGFPSRKNWNAILIKKWVKHNFGVEYSHSGMVYVMYRLNLSFTRPTYTLVKANPRKQEEFKQKVELLKKLLDGKIDHILFGDKSMIRDYQAIEKAWFLKG